MYQLQGFRARLFTDTISPCSNEASGPGRQNAAEWSRLAFHDMATAKPFFGLGGLGASIQFELTDGENTRPGHNTTLKFLANYLPSRSIMADLIAAGLYASVRSCGGPVVPVRAGRVDATSAGSPGVPQPENPVGIFINQFGRLGFSVTEMIQVAACGHTLGGVHTTEFPDIVPPRTSANGEVVTEYLNDSTTNPLVVGPSVKINKNSDFKIFSADNNATMKTLTDPVVFQSTCQTVFQKMIEVVPAGVTLTANPITPSMVKPVNMQLTLNIPGSTLLLTGYIRVRTTSLPASSIKNIRLDFKNGGNDYGSFGTCFTTATVQGTATGFDDTFAFFPVSTNIDATTGISSFTVTINTADGASQLYDNNGQSYIISDAILLQKPQSCLLQSSGALTATAIVRNDRAVLPVTLRISYLVPRNTKDGNPVPALNSATVAMSKGSCVGQYTIYTASYTIPGGLSFNARLDVSSGNGSDIVSDSFRAVSDLSGTCATFQEGVACAGSPTSPTSSLSPVFTSSGSTPGSSSTTSSRTSSSTSSAATLSHRSGIGAYTLVGCWTEGQGVRTLSDAFFADDGMTLESCLAHCRGFTYWGTEYGRECYCANALAPSSASAPSSDCNMPCAGNALEYCGAGNRLQLYHDPNATTTTQPPKQPATVAGSGGDTWEWKDCYTEASAGRALAEKSYAADNMTLESCAGFCQGFAYMGAEYGRECYCGDGFAAGSVTAGSAAECSFPCAGDGSELCGAANRLCVYERS